MRSRFLFEGHLLHIPGNEAVCAPRDGPCRAMEEEAVLEGVAQLYDGAHNLLASVGPFTGFLPRKEAVLGIAEGATREIAILLQVGKPACFQIIALEESEGALRPHLFRCRARQVAPDVMLAGLHPGYILPAVITHLESFRAFVDIGCGVLSPIGIESIFVSHIPHPDQRFQVGQAIFAVVQELDPRLGQVYPAHRELLSTWVENVAHSQTGVTVPDIARKLKEYGAFMELTLGLSGLAERKSDLREEGRVSVYIKAILPKRMEIKLLAIDTLPPLNALAPSEYFLTQGQIEKWKYAPEGCVKVGAEIIFA